MKILVWLVRVVFVPYGRGREARGGRCRGGQVLHLLGGLPAREQSADGVRTLLLQSLYPGRRVANVKIELLNIQVSNSSPSQRSNAHFRSTAADRKRPVFGFEIRDYVMRRYRMISEKLR